MKDYTAVQSSRNFPAEEGKISTGIRALPATVEQSSDIHRQLAVLESLID